MNAHPCRYPACNALLEKSGFCKTHSESARKSKNKDNARARQSDPINARSAAIRSSSRWAKVRGLKLAQDPLCEDPHGDHKAKNQTESARQVHHIQPLKDYPERAFDWSNLMSVCYKCHDKFNRAERAREVETNPEPTQITSYF